MLASLSKSCDRYVNLDYNKGDTYTGWGISNWPMHNRPQESIEYTSKIVYTYYYGSPR